MEDNIFKNLNKVGLTNGEKKEIKSRLLSHMRNAAQRTARLEAGQPTYAELQYIAFFRRNVLSGLVIVLLVFGGLSVAAEDALPGELLYPWKTGVVEPLQGNLMLSLKSKASWQAKLAETRLGELEKLASIGKLDSVVQLKVDSAINQYTNNFKTQVTDLKDQDGIGAAEVTSKFQSSIDAHEQVLSNLADKLEGTGDSSAVSNSIETLKNANEDIKSLRQNENLAGEGSSRAMKNAAEKKLEAVNSDLGQVNNLFNQNQSRLSAESILNISALLGEATSTIARGENEIGQGNFAGAFAELQKADQLLNQTTIIINAAIDLKIRDWKIIPDDKQADDTETAQSKGTKNGSFDTSKDNKGRRKIQVKNAEYVESTTTEAHIERFEHKPNHIDTSDKDRNTETESGD